MTDNAAPQGDGALTVDQAVSLLTAEPQTEQPEEQAQEAAPEPEAEENPPATEGEDTGEPEEVGDSEEVEATAEAEAEPVDAPQWWDAEDKAFWSKLDPKTQEVLAKQEAKREAVLGKAKQEAAEVRKQAEEEVKGVRALADSLGEFVPKAVDTFKTRWDDIDWQGWTARIANEADPEAQVRDLAAYNAARSEFEAQKAQVEQLTQAQRQAQAVAEAQYLREQADELKKLAPELASKPEAMREVASYLIGQGVPSDSLRTISAVEAVIAHKAMLYDQAQSKAKAAVVSKPKAPPVKSVASVATAAPVSSQQRQVQQAKNRFAQTRSVEDAMALLMSKGI